MLLYNKIRQKLNIFLWHFINDIAYGASIVHVNGKQNKHQGKYQDNHQVLKGEVGTHIALIWSSISNLDLSMYV